jgi:hypothetical protein
MLRQGSLRDERRRRSLLEDAAVAADDVTAPKPRRTSKASETYAELARMDCHARWSDFVPLRNWTVAAFLAAGLTSIAALQTAYFFVTQAEIWTAGELSVLDLARAESLAGWFVTLSLFAAAVLSFFVYSVRRYRLDDYRGRYRVWLWGGGLWLVMSIDASADLRGAVQAACIALSGRVGPLDGITWWLAPWSLAVLGLSLRMVLDMRGCRTATASLLIGLALLPVGLVLRRVPLPLAARELVMIASGCWLTGCWLLLFGQLTYARHVLLDAHGQLPVRAPKPKREKKAKPPAEAASKDSGKSAGTGIKRRDDLTTRIDPAHSSSIRPANSGIDLQKPAASSSGSVRPLPTAAKMTVGASSAAAAKPSAAPAKATQFINGRDEDDDSRPSNKLSRAERKRLRKQQRTGQYDDE